MDFENMGTMLGAKAAISEIASNAQAALARKDTELAQVRGTLAVEQAYAAGLLAQVEALRAELRRAAPQSKLLAATGQVFESGQPVTHLAVIYTNAFDKKAREAGIKTPERYRERMR